MDFASDDSYDVRHMIRLIPYESYDMDKYYLLEMVL